MPQNPTTPAGSLPQRALSIVPYLTADEVTRMNEAFEDRNKVRDHLMILTMFQTGTRVSEALSITPPPPQAR